MASSSSPANWAQQFVLKIQTRTPPFYNANEVSRLLSNLEDKGPQYRAQALSYLEGQLQRRYEHIRDTLPPAAQSGTGAGVLTACSYLVGKKVDAIPTAPEVMKALRGRDISWAACQDAASWVQKAGLRFAPLVAVEGGGSSEERRLQQQLAQYDQQLAGVDVPSLRMQLLKLKRARLEIRDAQARLQSLQKEQALFQDLVAKMEELQARAVTQSDNIGDLGAEDARFLADRRQTLFRGIDEEKANAALRNYEIHVQLAEVERLDSSAAEIAQLETELKQYDPIFQARGKVQEKLDALQEGKRREEMKDRPHCAHSLSLIDGDELSLEEVDRDVINLIVDAAHPNDRYCYVRSELLQTLENAVAMYEWSGPSPDGQSPGRPVQGRVYQVPLRDTLITAGAYRLLKDPTYKTYIVKPLPGTRWYGALYSYHHNAWNRQGVLNTLVALMPSGAEIAEQEEKQEEEEVGGDAILADEGYPENEQISAVTSLVANREAFFAEHPSEYDQLEMASEDVQNALDDLQYQFDSLEDEVGENYPEELFRRRKNRMSEAMRLAEAFLIRVRQRLVELENA